MACSSAHRDQMSTEGEVVASYSPTLLGENRKELLPRRGVFALCSGPTVM